jgi:lysophospholipase L1-like esterase
MRKIILILVLLAMAPCRAMAGEWVATWATAVEAIDEKNMPSEPLSNCALKQTIHVSVGGDELRLLLSNAQSVGAVDIKSVCIAAVGQGDAPTYLTFGGQHSCTIEGGKTLYSDSVAYRLQPLQLLEVVINYGDRTPQFATCHRGSRTSSYILHGEADSRADFSQGERLEHWYNIAALEVKRDGGPTECIAVLGNSITDGRGSTTDKQNRWTDALAEALGGDVAVLNLGIGGNNVVSGGLSEPAVERFDRDILAQQGVTTVVIFEGVNDIGGAADGFRTATALIKAYRKLIGRCRERHLRVAMATITPFKGFGYYSQDHEMARQMVNAWIRGTAEVDVVLDFDRLLCDPQDAAALRPDYAFDPLHPNPAAYAVMAKLAAEQLGLHPAE